MICKESYSKVLKLDNNNDNDKKNKSNKNKIEWHEDKVGTLLRIEYSQL